MALAILVVSLFVGIDPDPIFWNLGVLVVFMPVFIALHEFAHAAVGRLLALHVHTVRLGMGRSLARFRLGGTRVQLCAIPFSGVTIILPPSTRFRRLRHWLATAAGPAVHVVVGLALWPHVAFSDPSGPPFPSRFDPAASAFLANAWLLFFALLPLKTGLHEPDGLQLLTTPFKKGDAFSNTRSALASLNVTEAREDCRYQDALAICDEAIAEDPGDWILHHNRAAVLTDLGKPKEARQAFETALADPRVEGRTRELIRSNIAYSILLAEDREAHLDLADEHSRAAHEALKSEPAVEGTRGAVLLVRGRTAEAIQLLEKAYRLHHAASARAAVAAWLALAHANDGEQERARRFLAISRELDPAGATLAVVESLLHAKTAAAEQSPNHSEGPVRASP